MHDDPALLSLLSELRANAALPLERGRSMPPMAYRSEAFRALEKQAVFATEWHCVGRLDELADTGDYVTFTIDGEPIVVLRRADGELRAYANVCRHRMSPLLKGRGRVRRRIVCPYHSWCYGLDGRLVSAPFMSDGFDAATVRLPAFPVEVWEGWVYVSLNWDAKPLAPRLTELARRLARYRMSEYQTLFHVDEVWNTNWKALYENFSESYHVSSLHTQSIEAAQPTRLTDTSHDNDEAFYYYEQRRDPAADLAYPGHAVVSNDDLSEDEKNIIPMITVYPSHAFAVAPERIFWMSLQPEGAGRVRVRWGIDIFPGAIPPGWTREAFTDDIRRITEAVNAEDRSMLEDVYRNAGSGYAETAAISPLERTTWEFQRYLARMLDRALEFGQSAA